MTALTVEEFKQALPDKVKASVNQALIDQVNNVLSDPEMFENYRNNLISYGHVMQDGRFKITEYLNAVMYVSYKLMGKSNIEAYSKTFPDKIARFSQQGVAAKDIASYVTAYNKSKLVNLIFAQTLIPSWVLNQDAYQKAINVQLELMVRASSEKVRCDAANSLLTHLKPPEKTEVELKVSTTETSAIKELRQNMLELAAAQRQAITAGVLNAQQIAHSKVVGNVVDVDAKEI